MKAWVGRCAKEFRPPPEDGKESMKAVQEVTRPELYTIRAGFPIHSLWGAGMKAPKGKEGRAGRTHVSQVLCEGTSAAKVYHFSTVLCCHRPHSRGVKRFSSRWKMGE